ncbi:hypothetical protein [Legionella brunensis]|uniref:DrrA phosphatidylinositol 4-phosphate binding domain-containing protein n=1 Tax=Legionella brunensis TaxID=29422 RepID=A0A0W0S465_9GAMM|nr:hypothetical protein [Legionella brunensis]KTC78270.1 hypothetical protein Lbru_2562 [Legionella brunensis]
MLSLPKRIVNEYNSQQSVKQYLSGSTTNRVHSFHEVSAQYKEDYQGIKGDALKRAIINALKSSLAEVNSIEDFKKVKSQFLDSPEMKIIDKAQGRTTHLLGAFGLKTDSHRAVEKIFNEAEEEIRKNSPKPNV